jgi:hypothetical protein
MNDPKTSKPIPCPPEVLALVEKFDQHLEAYKSGQYNETQLRREFLDPLFSALGWDVGSYGAYHFAVKLKKAVNPSLCEETTS